MKLQVQRLHPGVALPSFAHEGDAGLDLVANDDLSLKPGQRALVPTGIAVAIPEGYAGFVQPRSGRAIQSGLGVLNSPGLIDSGYRGEVKVIVINLDVDETIDIKCGDKIAQLVILAVPQVEVIEVNELPATVRGESGFGSTGR